MNVIIQCLARLHSAFTRYWIDGEYKKHLLNDSTESFANSFADILQQLGML